MEALLKKEGDVESWNDDRLNELSRRVDDGFKEMRESFARVDARLDKLFYIQILTVTSFALALLTDRI